MARNELQKTDWRGRIFRYAPLILWACLVLFLSTGNASMSNTSRFIRPLLEFLFPNSPAETIDFYHAYIRKIAHVTEYAMLAFWAARAFSVSGRELLRRFWYLFALLLVAFVASTDEFNQSFDASRTSSIYDVLLDISGGTLMILCFYAARNLRRQRKF
ncbi:MAG: VanZ family protein [Acidobacteriota bacterium]|nr:VanZ family protein [Acidobacteriota bacterium]